MRSTVAAGALLALALAPAVAGAQSAAVKAKAERENDAGKARIRVVDLRGAVAHFRAAIALVPDPRYYFNLCYTLEKVGDLREARAACEVVVAGGADARLAAKARGRIDGIDRAIGEGRSGQTSAGAGDTLADDEIVSPGSISTVSPRPPGGVALGVPGRPRPAGPGGPPGAPRPLGRPPAAAPPVPVRPPPPPPVRPSSTWFFRLGFGNAGGSEDGVGDVGRSETTAFSIGAGVNRWLGPAVAIQIEALLSQRGFSVEGEFFDEAVGLTYGDLDLLLRVEPGHGMFRVAGVLGAYGALSLETNAGPLIDVAPVDLGIVFGAGIVLGRFRRSLSLELRWLHGLTDMDQSPAVSVQNRALLFMTGYTF